MPDVPPPTPSPAPPSPPGGDEFFVGYLPKAPPGVARVATAASAALLLLALLIGAAASTSQDAPVPSAWPDGITTLTGVLDASPYPVLFVPAMDGKAAQAVLITAEGKHGLLDPRDYCGPEEAARRLQDAALTRQIDALKALSGKAVTLRGTVLRRQGRILLELADQPDAIAPTALGSPIPVTPPPVEQLERGSFRGEIVDPKCYFGAMKPGSGQTHKACATRCVSGGITPVLIVKSAEGRWTYYMVTDLSGKPVNQQVLDLVGEPIEVSGSVSRRGGVLTLSVDPTSIRRL